MHISEWLINKGIIILWVTAWYQIFKKSNESLNSGVNLKVIIWLKHSGFSHLNNNLSSRRQFWQATVSCIYIHTSTHTQLSQQPIFIITSLEKYIREQFSSFLIWYQIWTGLCWGRNKNSYFCCYTYEVIFQAWQNHNLTLNLIMTAKSRIKMKRKRKKNSPDKKTLIKLPFLWDDLDL